MRLWILCLSFVFLCGCIKQTPIKAIPKTTIQEKGIQHIKDVLQNDFIKKIKWRYKLYQYWMIPDRMYVNDKSQAIYIYAFERKTFTKKSQKPQKPLPFQIVPDGFEVQFINPIFTYNQGKDYIYLIFWMDKNGKIYHARWQGE